MPQVSRYLESKLAFDGDPLETAVLLANATEWNQHHLLYECDEEVMLGLGAEATVEVHAGETLLRLSDDERRFENEDVASAIAEALAEVPLEDYRAYGTADFELARHLHGLDLDDDARNRPLMRMFVPKAEVRFRPGTVLLRALDVAALDRLRACLDSVASGADGVVARLRHKVSGDAMELSEDAQDARRYKGMVAEAIGEVAARRYRKVILSRRAAVAGEIDLAASFLKARSANSPARSFVVVMDGAKAFGISPETVVEVYGRNVHSSPLAGTRAILPDVMDTLRLREELVSDSKEIAEHAISVYLSFDEMTMVCDPSTVCVTQFMLVAVRGSVQHLASRLQGELLSGCNPWHAFCALFPAVTASGVPKREAIDAIGRLESGRRGLYSGCVFVCDQSGMLDAALVLRSLFQEGGQTWLQAGAGIMNLSNPERELEETREKLGSLAPYLVAADSGGRAT